MLRTTQNKLKCVLAGKHDCLH